MTIGQYNTITLLHIKIQKYQKTTDEQTIKFRLVRSQKLKAL